MIERIEGEAEPRGVAEAPRCDACGQWLHSTGVDYNLRRRLFVARVTFSEEFFEDVEREQMLLWVRQTCRMIGDTLVAHWEAAHRDG
jgi:hypothetical protein